MYFFCLYKRTMTFAHFVNECLHDATKKKAKYINGFIVFLIIVSVTSVPLHFLPEEFGLVEKLEIFDKIVVSIFTVEYFLRIWSAKHPMKYIFSWWGMIDFLAICPFFLYQMGLIGSPIWALLLRSLRILKLGKIYELERIAIARSSAGGKHGAFKILEGEVIERIVQKHPLVFLGRLFIPLSFISAGLVSLIVFKVNIWSISGSFVALLLSLLFFFIIWLDFNYDVIYITNRRLILQDREIFGAVTNDITYESITNVRPSNVGFWHWLWGYGTICIETAAYNGTLYFTHAPHAHSIVRHIATNRQKALERHGITSSIQSAISGTVGPVSEEKSA
jgi:hypothetical protein